MIPRHVAIIMDGNGRWAKKRLLPRSAGHRAGLRRMRSLIGHIFSRGVEDCTLFALSVENLSRPQEELDALYGLFFEYFTSEVPRLKDSGVKVKAVGDLTLLPPRVAEAIACAERDTAQNTAHTLAFAIAYGARRDIVAACNNFVREGKEATEESFSAALSTAPLPPVDLLIRTGREMRLSNFLLYESAYAELWFSDKMFPDFTKADFDRALEEYQKRDRRFGTI